MTGVNDIQKYIEKATGVKLDTVEGSTGDYAIIIKEEVVPVEGSANKGVENFSVKSEGNNIVITGAADRGAMYGCYDFLEDVIGWIFITWDYDYIDPVDELDIKDVDYTESSYFEYRDCYWGSYLDIDEIGNNIEITDMTNKHKLWKKAWVKGLHNCHTFESLTNGEYKNGDRQPCLTDDEIYKVIRDNVFKYLDADPTAQIISVSQNDAADPCECANCQAIVAEEESESGPIIRFVNKIAAEVAEKYPDVIIHTFAYSYSAEPPKKVKAADNVMVQYCTLEADMTCPIADGVINEGSDEARLIGWGEVCKNIYVWDYTTNFAYSPTPLPNLKYEVLAGNVKFFYEQNARGLFEQGLGAKQNNGEFERLRAYLLAKVMWNPYMTEDEFNAHVEKFMKAYYGEAWNDVYAVMNEWQACETMSVPCFDPPKLRPIVMAGYLPEWVDKLEESKALIETKVQFEHVDCSMVQFEFFDLEVKFETLYNSSNDADKALAQELSLKLQNKMQKYWIAVTDMEFASVPNFTEFTVKPSEWRYETDHLLNWIVLD